MATSLSPRERAALTAESKRWWQSRFVFVALASLADPRLAEVDALLASAQRAAAAEGVTLYKHERRQLVALLERLEALGFGELVLGRQGRKTRFVGRRDLRELGVLVAGDAAPAGPAELTFQVTVRLGADQVARLQRLLRP